MEELIYLAVVVGWFLLNAYKKSQAKKQQEQSAPQQQRRQQEEYAPEEPSTMEDLLRQLMGEEQRTPEPVRVPQPKAAPSPPREPLVRKPVHQIPAAARTSRLTPRTPMRRENSRSKQPSVPLETEDMNPHTDSRFDLRNAIVYSAILQRPYA